MKVAFLATAAGAALSVGFASPNVAMAQAQSRPEAQSAPHSLDEVVVTARRREERLQDVPVAVTALSASRLAETNIQSLSEVQRLVPSMTITGVNGRATAGAVTLRGQRQADQTITFDPSVGVYLNEVYIPRPQGVDTAAFDLSSIQVLKGPQGTLFGRNTTGGAVLMTTRGPGTEFGGYVRPYIETPIGAGVQGAVDLPLTDWASLRLAGNYQWRRGYTKVVNLGQRQDDRNRWSGRATLDLHPNDAFKSVTVISGFKLNENGVAIFPLVYNPGLSGSAAVTNTVRALGYPQAFADTQALGWHETALSTPGKSLAETFSISNATTYHINDRLLLKNIIGYGTIKSSDIQDQDGTPANVIVNGPSLASMKNFSEELQLQGSGKNYDWVMGVYSFVESGYDLVYTYTFKLPLVGSYTNNYFWGRNASKSAFAHGSYTLPFENRTRVFGGLRYTEDTREVDFRNRAVSATGAITCSVAGVAPAPAECSLRKSVDFHALTWDVGVDYQPMQDTLLYGTISRGYRSGGWNGRASSVPTQDPYRPEKIINYEIGAKTEFGLGRTRAGFNAALYYSDYKDIQRSIVRGIDLPGGTRTTVTLFVNAASATIKGGEFEGWIRPIDNLTLRARYSYTRARYKDFLTFNPATGRNNLDASGNKFAGVAPNQGGVGVDWDIASTENGSFRLTADASYADPFELNDLNVPGAHTDANLLVDSSLVWNNPMGKRMTATLYVKNMFNAHYIVGGTALGAALEINNAFHGAPRVVGVSLNVPFGAE
jgi:iron complex outermembrane receptor protein